MATKNHRIEKGVTFDANNIQKRLSIGDFEPLAIIGKGAFGEVRLVRLEDGKTRHIYGTK